MFWNKRTPIDHKFDTCELCGAKTYPHSIFHQEHTRDDCLQWLKFTANAAYRRVLEVEKGNAQLTKELSCHHGRIIGLEKQARFTSLKIDSLAGDIGKLYKLIEANRPVFSLDDISKHKGPPSPRPKPKPRPKK